MAERKQRESQKSVLGTYIIIQGTLCWKNNVFNTAYPHCERYFPNYSSAANGGLQSRARGNTVTEKIKEAGDKAGSAANEMGNEKDILRGLNVQENSHARIQKRKGVEDTRKKYVRRNALIEN